MACALFPFCFSAVLAADVVKVTPVGGQDGEFCRLDREFVF
jgi:hypothetical protein